MKIDLKRKDKSIEGSGQGTVVDFSAGSSADNSADFSAGFSVGPSADEGRGSRRKGLKLPKMPQMPQSPLKQQATSVKEDSYEDIPDFAAAVRSSDPILKVSENSKVAAWKKDLSLNLACAAILMAAAGFFCYTIYEFSLLIYCLPCFVVFMLLTTLESVMPGRTKLLAAAAIAAALIVTGIVWRNTVFGGFAMYVDQFYNVAEEAQAYVYKRLPVSPSDSEMAGRIGAAWVTALVGLIAALPPVNMRRGVSVLIAAFVMLAFAYYGLIPSAICMAVLAAALMAAASRGGILPALPVMLIVFIVFGAVMLINPGENYDLSVADENFRDRFALRSALLESDSMQEGIIDEWGLDETDNEEDFDDSESVFEGEYGTFAALGLLALIAAAIGAAAYLIHKRLEKRRAANRKGINSSDAREAVVAMFPYTVKWLKGFGIEQTDAAVTSMIPNLKREYSDEYSRQFEEMYVVWSEAAYSDHEVPEDVKVLMQNFMNDTIKKTKEKCKLKDTFRLRYRYAL